MKSCHWCTKTMKRQNYAKHSRVCIYKNDLKATKEHILTLITNNPDKKEENKRLQQKINTLEQINLELTEKLKIIMKITTESFNKYNDNTNDKNPNKIVDEMIIKHTTKNNYKTEWNLFIKWKNENNKILNTDSVNTYLSQVQCKPSTLIKKREILQKIMKEVIGDHIQLNKIRLRYRHKRKYEMTEKEIDQYLNEQREISYEYYVVQFLMIKYALRIGTVAAIKLKDIQFANDKDIIHFKDVKSDNINSISIDTETKQILSDFIKDHVITRKNDYIFCKEKKNSPIEARAHRMAVTVNRLIKNSEVFDKNDNYQYTSHMFRRTRVNLELKEEKERIKTKGRKILGHRSGSAAINSYIEL